MLVKKLIVIVVMLWVSSTTFAQTRLGILYTQEELTIWRQRAQSGPYKTLGDASVNSPGDWTRIQKNADAFLLNPKAELTDTTFELGYISEPKQGYRLRDAAFVSLLLRTTNPTLSSQYAKAIRTILLTQSRNSDTDFTKYAYFKDLAGWVLAEYMVRNLFAYDYIKDAGVLSSAEKTELNTWFYNSANFFARNLHNDLGGLFPYRLNGNYAVTTGPAETGSTSSVEYTHVNANGSLGNKIAGLARWYNNRRASHAVIVGLVDVFLKNVGYQAPPVKVTLNGLNFSNPLETHAKSFVKEWIKYSVYADGMQGEFERGIAENPFKGFNYSTCNLFVVSIMADAYARRGDFELYNYTTSEGLWGTQGGTKSIRLAVETNLKMVDGTIKRYFNTVTENNRYRNVQYLNENLSYVSDVWYTMSNVYWKSTYQKGVYTRTGAGTVAYPATNIGSTAGLNAWGGTAQMLPGCLFMYGQMEGKVWPYPSTNKAPIASITAPTAGANFAEASTITITANASDIDGTIGKVEFFKGSTKLGEDLTSPYSYTMSNAGVGAYSLTVKATDNLGASTTSAAVTINVNVATGQILREEWRNVIGSLVSTIPLTTTPTSSSFLTSFEEASNVGDSLASRICGYVHPTTSGNYTFWIAGDDYCELWLSTSEDPTQKVKIAFVNGYTKSRDWTKYASQQSAPITLLAGKKYYIEALHKENIGGDNLAVGWDLPDGSQERPIPGNRLSPFVPTAARIATSQLEQVQHPTTLVVSAYPNPVADLLTLRFSAPPTGPIAITIIDQLGQAVYKGEKHVGLGDTMTSIDLAAISLKAGVYFLKVGQQTTSKTLRIVKK